MEKFKNGWFNGIIRAWEMLYCFSVDGIFSRFTAVDKSKCSGVHVLSGLLISSFVAGLILALLGLIVSLLLSPVPGAIFGAVLITGLLLFSDRCAGVTLFSNMVAKRTQGRKMGDILLEQDSSPEHIDSGIASAVFSFVILLKLVMFYFIMLANNFYLLTLVTLASAFTQAFVLNAHTGQAAYFGFANSREKNMFYILAIVLLLCGCKFNLMMALAFLGGIFLWNYWLKESFIKLAYGKSDESLTLYGECASMIASVIAFIYSAGAFKA